MSYYTKSLACGLPCSTPGKIGRSARDDWRGLRWEGVAEADEARVLQYSGTLILWAVVLCSSLVNWLWCWRWCATSGIRSSFLPPGEDVS